MHCTACVMNIDGELEDTEGIHQASTSYASQKTEVTFEEKKVTEGKIKKIIQNLGYSAS